LRSGGVGSKAATSLPSRATERSAAADDGLAAMQMAVITTIAARMPANRVLNEWLVINGDS